MGTLKDEKKDQVNLVNKGNPETLPLLVRTVEKPVPPPLSVQGIGYFESKKNNIERILNEPSVYPILEELFHLENGPQTLSVKLLRDALIKNKIANMFLNKLVGSISVLEHIYGIGPSIRNDECGKIRMELIPRKPEYSRYIIKGKELTKIKTPNKGQKSAETALIQVRLEFFYHRFELFLVVGLLADPSGYNHLAMTIHSRLTVIALLKRLGRTILHDPRLRVRKVVLSLPIRLL